MIKQIAAGAASLLLASGFALADQSSTSSSTTSTTNPYTGESGTTTEKHTVSDANGMLEKSDSYRSTSTTLPPPPPPPPVTTTTTVDRTTTTSN